MARPALEIADIFRDHGPAWRKANAGHVSLGQLKVMSAIESCRTEALAWMKQRNSELLDVPYFHVVFTLPARIAAIAYQNKAVVYDLLFKASSQTISKAAADPSL